MKISEVVTSSDPQQQRVAAMKKVADTANKRAKVAAASMQVTKAQQKLRQAQTLK